MPLRISKAIEHSPLITSAFLSELYRESKIKMSSMRIGSSPLYYLEGQEQKLENYTDFLNQREKEAMILLKKEFLLEDDKLSPMIRVAIREIKDFAIPLKVKIDNEEKTVWKYFTIPNENVKEIWENRNPSMKNQDKKEIQKQVNDEIKQEIEKEVLPIKIEKELIPINIEKEINPTKIKRKEIIKTSEFADKIQEYLVAKEVEILEIYLTKKKELEAKIRIDTLFGKQEFYLIAKDKKKITETDLTLAYQKAQTEKMPSLIISPGEIDKKTQNYKDTLRNLVKFERFRF